MTAASSEWVEPARRQVRLVSILSAAGRAGIAPLPALQLHAIAYFADALAPVWNLQILDAQLLKRREGPMSPALQHDVDQLVARGVVLAANVRHVSDGNGVWRLDATYSLNDALATPILQAIGRFEGQSRLYEFVEEVVYAVSGLGLDGIAEASDTDAAYSNVLVDFGGLVDLDDSSSTGNLSAQVALRFGQLARPMTYLSSAEMVHLYVRELYGRLRSVG